MVNNEHVLRGQVWYCKFERGVGHIQSGVRPCLIVSNNTCNSYSEVIHVVPITTKIKNEQPTHVPIRISLDSTILCEQIMLIHKDNLIKKIGSVVNMEKINKAMKIQLGIDRIIK